MKKFSWIALLSLCMFTFVGCGGDDKKEDAAGEDGGDGEDGADGENGADGEDGGEGDDTEGDE